MAVTFLSNNQLKNTTSPYLQQHAENPVHWYPWGKEALKAAKEQNKPILLSIGYSACHWCHVMAHESFEDETTAKLMNDLFINIKVDREERPDLDKIYQKAYQLMNQRGGGWPLTVFLTPDDHAPFYTGTYFPKEPSYGRPSFKQVLSSIDEAWQSREPEIRQQNKHVITALSETKTSQTGFDLKSAPIKQSFKILQKVFDPIKGGFSKAPKFPHPEMLNQCLLYWFSEQNNSLKKSPIPKSPNGLDMAEITAIHMTLGGMNDQVGGGFCRYSTDDDWMIPHFEKMLYDNGPLLSFYADLYQITHKDSYSETIKSTISWVLREMQSTSGGYYSAQDADSEGVEGKYYVWTPEEIKRLLKQEEFNLISTRFSLDKPANFEGLWNLHCDANAQPHSLNTADKTLLNQAKEKLFNERNKRIHPGLDDKILTSWNALMIKGMVKSSQLLNEPKWGESAEKSLNFIQDSLWKDGRLFAVHKDGISHLNAYLDDYAYLIDAILELLSIKWNTNYLSFAIELTDVLMKHYQDTKDGGFFFISDEHEKLIYRPKSFSDEATPSGNGVIAKVLIRLGYLLGRTDYLDAAEKTLMSAWSAIEEYPHAHCSLLHALHEYLSPPTTIIIRGHTEKMKPWLNKLLTDYNPHRQYFAIPATEENLPEALETKKADKSTIAYNCKGMVCSSPIKSIKDLV